MLSHSILRGIPIQQGLKPLSDLSDVLPNHHRVFARLILRGIPIQQGLKPQSRRAVPALPQQFSEVFQYNKD